MFPGVPSPKYQHSAHQKLHVAIHATVRVTFASPHQLPQHIDDSSSVNALVDRNDLARAGLADQFVVQHLRELANVHEHKRRKQRNVMQLPPMENTRGHRQQWLHAPQFLRVLVTCTTHVLHVNAQHISTNACVQVRRFSCKSCCKSKAHVLTSKTKKDLRDRGAQACSTTSACSPDLRRCQCRGRATASRTFRIDRASPARRLRR